MSTSTDAVLFYGYHLSENVEIPEAAYDVDLAGPVRVDNHCSDECSMPYVYWTASRITAWRGYPKPINPATLADVVDIAEVGEPIRAFAKEHGLPGPGEVVDPEWPQDKASDLGWWLVSWWG